MFFAKYGIWLGPKYLYIAWVYPCSTSNHFLKFCVFCACLVRGSVSILHIAVSTEVLRDVYFSKHPK